MTASHLSRRKREERVSDRNHKRQKHPSMYPGDKFFPPRVEARRKPSLRCLRTHLWKLPVPFFTLTLMKNAATRRWRDRKCYFLLFGGSFSPGSHTLPPPSLQTTSCSSLASSWNTVSQWFSHQMGTRIVTSNVWKRESVTFYKS